MDKRRSIEGRLKRATELYLSGLLKEDDFDRKEEVNKGDLAILKPVAATAKVKNHRQEHGILLGPGDVFANVLRFQLPLVITEENIERAVDTIDKALVAVA